MAKYILATLEALATGDISGPDAIYSLTAHIVASGHPVGAPVLRDTDVQLYVERIVHAVVAQKVSALAASRYLIIARDKLSTGARLDEVFKSAPENLTENQ